MPKLSETNPHLRTETQRREVIARAVISSCACEGIFVTAEDLFPSPPPSVLTTGPSLPTPEPREG